MTGGTPHDRAPGGRLGDNNSLGKSDSLNKSDPLSPGDPLWRLLADAPRPQPDAWFAARTLARCRNEGLGSDDKVPTRAFARIWQWALGGGLAACMAVVLVAHNQATPVVVDKQQNVQDAFEIMASIDTDSDPSSSSSWQDSSR